MGDEFLVYTKIEDEALDQTQLEFIVQRAKLGASVEFPQLGKKLKSSKWNIVGKNQGKIAQLKLTKNVHADDTATAEIDLQTIPITGARAGARAGAGAIFMTDAESVQIFAWAEQLCCAQSLERTPWLNPAVRTPHKQDNLTRVWSSAADLWNCSFARVLVRCNFSMQEKEEKEEEEEEEKEEEEQVHLKRLQIVPQCRRAVLAGYTPCSMHMWDHKQTNSEDRKEILRRWRIEALPRRLVAAFKSQEAGNIDDDRSFGKVKRLLALYLCVAAIGTPGPNIKSDRDFRRDTKKQYEAVFVKSLFDSGN
jgi:hypothetical protein